MHRYPQINFVRAISKRLDSKGPESILDLCCGYGFTTNTFANENIRWNCVGLDSDEGSIAKAKSMFPGRHFLLTDMWQFLHSEDLSRYSVIALINSWFCIPQVEQLPQLLGKRALPTAQIAIILPNTDSPNYKAFCRTHDSAVNVSILNREQIIELFKRQSYDLTFEEGVGYAIQFGRRFPSFPGSEYLRNFVLRIESWVRQKLNHPASYVLFIFQKRHSQI